MPIYPSSSIAVDNETIETNASGEIAAKPSVITQSSTLNDITYSTNTTLSADVYANNVTIDSGVTVTTNGYNFYCAGTFTNNGTINTGTGSSGGAGSSSGNGSAGSGSTTSYGGSGGGGGGGYGSGSGSGGQGGSTVAAGGAGSTAYGGNGSTPATPTLTSSLISTWYSNGMSNYLNGAGGGGGGYDYGGGGGGNGGNGSGGLYIQANKIIAGTINASGNNAPAVPSSTDQGGGGGGGGGGMILLAYGVGGYTAGTYTFSGGTGGASNYSYYGGNGGNGGYMTFSGTPITFGGYIYSSATNSINNRTSQYNYTTQSTSTSAVIASQGFTPSTSGLVSIRATVSASNNTIGGTVQLQIQNGSTNLSTSQKFTQESLARNPFTITLYTEQLFSSPFSAQTYNINLIATGGTATAVIQEFTIEEIY